MARNRISYGLVLFCTTAFYIFFNGYLSLYVFVLSLVLPFLSLLISLPGMRGVKAELSTDRATVQKGGNAALRLKVYSTSRFFCGRMKVKLLVQNELMGEEKQETFFFTAARAPQVVEHVLSSEHCGQVTCRITKLRVCDYLGLFSFPKKPGIKRECSTCFFPFLFPIELEVQDGHTPDAESERFSKVRSGDDPSEIFALRDYREGDRLSRIHWKLSQKLGQTLVKEMSLPISDHIFFYLDFTGSGIALDAILDTFSTLSSFLTEQEVAHRVGFCHSRTGELTVVEIVQEEDFFPALQTILVSGGGRHTLTDPQVQLLPNGISHIIYLSGALESTGPKALRERFPNARLSILLVTGEKPTEAIAAANALGGELTEIKPGHIPESLGAFQL